LGSWITEDGRCEKEVNTRIAMTNEAFWQHKELMQGTGDRLAKVGP